MDPDIAFSSSFYLEMFPNRDRILGGVVSSVKTCSCCFTAAFSCSSGLQSFIQIEAGSFVSLTYRIHVH